MIDELVGELRQRLRQQQLVVAHATWARHRDEKTIRAHLQQVLGTSIDDVTLVDAVRRQNEGARLGSRTRGAAKELASVAKDQGGHFCLLCGAETELQVDHIVPASLGGGDELNNYQLLCAPCNGGKGDTQSLLWEQLRVTTSTAVSTRLRYVKLWRASVDDKGRRRGVCPVCSRRVPEVRLSVVPLGPTCAANFMTTTVACNGCLET